MSDVTQQEIDDELERAQKLKQIADEFIDIATGINNAECIRLREERDIDIDSNRWVPLDDIPLGEEVLRVKEDLPKHDIATQILENLTEGTIPAADSLEDFQKAVQALDNFENTLQDVRAEEVINSADNDNDFYHEEEYEEEDDEDK